MPLVIIVAAALIVTGIAIFGTVGFILFLNRHKVTTENNLLWNILFLLVAACFMLVGIGIRVHFL
jgi:hypothetical protein